MKHYNIIRYMMVGGFAAIVTAGTLTACSADESLATTEGGDHPGVTLTLQAPTVSIEGVTPTSATAATKTIVPQSPDNDVTAYGFSYLHVYLIDGNGNILQSKDNNMIMSYYSYNGSEWTDDTPSDGVTPLYVTGGSGTYRMRVSGYIYTEDKGPVYVAYAGPVSVTDNNDGTGSFALTDIKPTTAAVVVKLKDANGNLITENKYTIALTGITEGYPNVFSNKNATTTDNMIMNFPISGYSKLNMMHSKYFVDATILPTTGTDDKSSAACVSGETNVGYPACWYNLNKDADKASSSLTNSATTAANYGEGCLGSLTTLMTVYKQIGNNVIFFNYEDGKIYTNSDYTTLATKGTDYEEYPVTVPDGTKYKMQAGKMYTFNLTVNGSDISIASMTVGDFLDGGTITADNQATFTGTIQQFIDTYTALTGEATKATWLKSLDGGKIVLTDTDVPAAALWSDKTNPTVASLRGILQKMYNNDNTARVSIYMPYLTGKTTDNIPAYAFKGCNAITSFNAPKFVGGIEEDAFSFCGSLTTVNFPKVTGTIGVSAFSYSDLLTTAYFPEITGIGGYTFYGCNLTTAYFPKATSIGSCAFKDALNTSGCKLTLGAVSTVDVTTTGNHSFEIANTTSTDLIFTATPTAGDYTAGSKIWAGKTWKSITVEQ